MSAYVHSVVTLPARPEIGWRTVTEADDAFLYELYAGTRAEELAATGWPRPQQDAFLRQQFAARTAAYRTTFPTAVFAIIQQLDQPVGAWGIQRTAVEFRLIDLALLPPHRSQGVGSALMRHLLHEAARVPCPVRLHALNHNRAVCWYERLGFQPCGTTGAYLQLEWRPAQVG